MLTIPTELANKVDAFSEEYPEIIYAFILEKLKETLRQGNSITILYGIKNTNITVAIPQSTYPNLLDNMMTYFVEEEMYEHAGQCNTLANRFQIEEVIKGM
jgi:hypothetical protein